MTVSRTRKLLSWVQQFLFRLPTDSLTSAHGKVGLPPILPLRIRIHNHGCHHPLISLNVVTQLDIQVST